MPGKAKDVTNTSGQPAGVHTVVSMPPSAPDVEFAGAGQPNAMLLDTPSGSGFLFPDSPEDADLMHVEHGAVPANPVLWPWPGRGGAPSGVDMALHLVESGACPQPALCFPGGIDPSWSAVTCEHAAETVTLPGR